MSYGKLMAASAQYTLACQLCCLMPLATGSFLALCASSTVSSSTVLGAQKPFAAKIFQPSVKSLCNS